MFLSLAKVISSFAISLSGIIYFLLSNFVFEFFQIAFFNSLMKFASLDPNDAPQRLPQLSLRFYWLSQNLQPKKDKGFSEILDQLNNTAGEVNLQSLKWI